MGESIFAQLNTCTALPIKTERFPMERAAEVGGAKYAINQHHREALELWIMPTGSDWLEGNGRTTGNNVRRLRSNLVEAKISLGLPKASGDCGGQPRGNCPL